MRLRTLSAAGIGAAALVLATLPSGATASGSHGTGIPLHAASVTSSHSATATPTASPTRRSGRCGTGFGPELPTPDGIISWNDGSGTSFDTAGAADIVCMQSQNLGKVKVYGYFGAASETFHVTFYGDSTTSGSSEPDDTNVLCDYPSITGAAGGQYPVHALTKLLLPSPCSVPAGVSWVSVQNLDASGPWYWEMQDAPQNGQAGPDWVDRHDAFGSGCIVFDNDRYLADCLGYPYADWMLKVK